MVAGLAASGLLLFSPPLAGEPRQATRGWRALLPAASLPVLSIMLANPPGTAWLPDTPSRINAKLHLSLPVPRELGVMWWAFSTSPPGSLFAIPPVNADWVRFRLVTRRGAYVTVHDINQLMYVRQYVRKSVTRLATLGVIVRGPHRFDSWQYAYPTCERLARLAADRVDYYVLPGRSAVPGGSVFAYRDEHYSVLDVQRTVPGCHPEAD